MKQAFLEACRRLGHWCSSFVNPRRLPHQNRERIISAHLTKYQSGFDPENALRACLNSIAEIEGWSYQAPGNQHIYKWEYRKNIRPEYHQLSRSLRHRFFSRNLEFQKAQQRRNEEEAVAFLSRNQDLIERFCQVAERKVSKLDDYGAENWKVLPKELDVIIEKLQEREPSLG
jgi:hypothetical protein